MAKQKRAAGNAGPTLSEQIEQQEQRKLLASAQSKGLRDLNASEKAAVRKHEEGIFTRVFSSCSKTLATWALGSSPKVIVDNARRRGFPWPEGKRDRVNLLDVTQWLWRYFLEHPLPEARSGNLTEDDVLLAGASQELKDEFLRQRILERRLVIRQKSMEVVLLEESHIPAEKVYGAFMAMAEVVRKRSANLQRKFDGEAGEQISLAFEDLADAFEKRALNEFGNDSECEPADPTA